MGLKEESTKSLAIKNSRKIVSLLCHFNTGRPPSFKNLPHRNIFNLDDIDDAISADNPTDVWLIELGDPDPQDIPGLVLTMEPPSPYFTIKKDSSEFNMKIISQDSSTSMSVF